MRRMNLIEREVDQLGESSEWDDDNIVVRSKRSGSETFSFEEYVDNNGRPLNLVGYIAGKVEVSKQKLKRQGLWSLMKGKNH